jgi:hypothetical protein
MLFHDGFLFENGFEKGLQANLRAESGLHRRIPDHGAVGDLGV